MVSNKTLIFHKIPSGLPVPGEHLVVEDRPLDTSAAPPGGLVIQILSMSLDPYLRTRMRDPSVPSFMPPFIVGDPITNAAIARVLKSDSPDYREGDLVTGIVPVAEYAAISTGDLPFVTKIDNQFGLSPDLFLGPLGPPGLTAYSSLYEIGKPKKGETLFVSSAAGAVGSMVGQLAKREGLRVIGRRSLSNTPLEQRYGVRNLVEVFIKRLTMRGFILDDPDFGPAYAAEHQRNVQQWIADGSLKGKLHVTTGGIDRAAEAFVDIFKGRNFGKAVLEVKKVGG